MIKKILMSIAVFVLVFFGLSAINKEEGCINLYVDYNVLDKGTKITKCIDANNRMTALDVLKKANFEIEGTKKYGLAIVCRVNNLPDQNLESCEEMPSEKAYWAIIIKEKQVLPLPTKEWGWGQLAVNQQYLNPGDSIGLVWANNGKVVFP
jgi:hypothetical protein